MNYLTNYILFSYNLISFDNNVSFFADKLFFNFTNPINEFVTGMNWI